MGREMIIAWDEQGDTTEKIVRCEKCLRIMTWDKVIPDMCEQCGEVLQDPRYTYFKQSHSPLVFMRTLVPAEEKPQY
jgi:hypothetical protein